MNELLIDELTIINGGGAKEVVSTVVGVCGGIAGAASGAVLGYAAAGHFFTGVIAVGGGIVGGVSGAYAGYVGGKEAGAEAYDTIVGFFN